MNKELFVSSTPHETKVGLVEDDLLAEIYLERENEYTLAGSIYKGRVTRVLPGMQSAFVDIGLERDAFLYVSDFMDLEEHDDDLTDVVPANRGVQDMRPQQARSEAASEDGATSGEALAAEGDTLPVTDEGSVESDTLGDASAASESDESANGGESQERDRGQWRGRRRRRGGRRDRGSDRGGERGEQRSDRGSEQRYSRPAESVSRPAGPPAGYQPILLPGESISKYRRYSSQPAVETAPQSEELAGGGEPVTEASAQLATTFPEDEPIFAAAEASAEPLHEQHEDVHPVTEETAESAATSTNWNREFRRPEEESTPVPVWSSTESVAAVEAEPAETTHEDERVEEEDSDGASDAVAEEHLHETREEPTPIFAAPGTIEEETIDEEEVDTIHYESSSDEGFDEFEEETQAAHDHLNGDAHRLPSRAR